MVGVAADEGFGCGRRVVVGMSNLKLACTLLEEMIWKRGVGVERREMVRGRAGNESESRRAAAAS